MRTILPACLLLLAASAAAEEDFQAKCNAGDANGCVMLGFTLDRAGRDAESTAAFDRACTLKNWNACGTLAQRLRTGKGAPKDPQRAFKIYSELCDSQPQLATCFYVGEMLEKGEGVRADAAKSKEYTARANANLRTQMLEVAKKSRELARKNPESFRAAEQTCNAGAKPTDWTQCMVAITLYETTDKEKTFALMDQGCRLDPNVCGSIGKTLAQHGLDTLSEEFLSTRCELGNASTCTMIGFDAVEVDSVRALLFLDRACRLGSNTACAGLEKLRPDAATKKRAAEARLAMEQKAIANSWELCQSGNRHACDTVVRASKDAAQKAKAQQIIDTAVAAERAKAQLELDIQAAARPWVERLAQVMVESKAQAAERLAGDRLDPSEVGQLSGGSGGPLGGMQQRVATPEDAEGGRAWRERRKARLTELRALVHDVRAVLEAPVPENK